GYITILRRSLDREETDRIVSAGRSTDFEGFHPFDSRIDASRPGYLLFSSRTAGRDALVIYDLARREIAGRYQFPELVSVLSPIWEPDGKSVIFSGMAESGLSDLYRVRLPGGELEKLTDDPYQDIDPSLSPDGTRLVFASDRTAGGRDGAVNLFILRLGSGELSQLTSGSWVDETPRWEQNGRIYFASSRDGVLNAFSIDTAGRGRRETSSWTGAFDPTWVPERNGLLVGGFHDLSWNIYYVPEDSAAQADTFTVASSPSIQTWAWGSTADSVSYDVTAEPYERHFTLDFAAGEAVFIPGFGGAQGFQFFLSDILSDEVLIFGLSSFQGKNLGSVFENINGSALYINQKHRLNWGVGLFRLKGAAYQDRLTISYRETTVGALGLLRYPLNRFERLEGQVVVEHSDR
ncbi:MAG: TolB family protein, partial [Gemmatimonadales bacterium]